MKRMAATVTLLALAALLGACGSVEKNRQSEAGPAAGGQSPASQPQATPQAGPAGNPIVMAARSQGVSKCLPRIESLANSLTQGATYRAYAVTDDVLANERLYSLVVSRMSGEGTHQLVSATVVPDQVCSATFDISTVWGMPCAELAKQAFSAFRPAATLTGGVTVMQGAGLQHLYLMPTPTGGCLTLLKETLY